MSMAHKVQFYEHDAFLIDAMARFAGAGLGAGDGVVMVATEAHLADLAERLDERGFRIDAEDRAGRYVALDATATLDDILVRGAVDPTRFATVVRDVIARAAGPRGAPVRVFGEMVSLLWAAGNRDAALQLEALWNELGRTIPLELLCAYPLEAFSRDADAASFRAICREHSAVIPAESYLALGTEEERNRAIVELQRKASVLESELAERSRMQATLRERNGTLQALIDASPLPIVLIDPDATVRLWNAAAERTFGWSEQEVLGRPIPIVPPDKRDECASVRAAVVRGETREGVATRRLRKDGRAIDVMVSAAAVPDDTGDAGAIVLLFEDVTESHRAEQARRNTHRELMTLYEMGRALSAELDLQRLLQSLTDAATQLTNARFGAFVHPATGAGCGSPPPMVQSGAPSNSFLEGGGISPGMAILESTFAGERLIRIDDLRADLRYGQSPAELDGGAAIASYLAVAVVGRTGEVFGGLFLGHPEPGVFGEEAERIVLGLAAQAAVAIENAHLYEAERRARSDAETANRAKDEFLAMLGHELRNPLATLRNAVASARLDPGLRDHALEIAGRGVDQLARLVDDLLDVARITRGRITLRKRPVSLRRVVEAAVESKRRLIDRYAHSLSVVLPDADVRLDVDATRLEQVLVNLLGNAARYTDPGGRILLHATHENGAAVIRVRDDGIGIAPEVLPRIFELFVQADRSLDRSEGGLGIGLTVAKRLVELHGGTLEAHSEGAGKGAEFVVRLPGAVVEGEAPKAAGEVETSARGVRVLVVEDNADAAESLVMLLQTLGHRATLAHDGPAALEIVQYERFDVILMDIGLPGMDGYQVARRMRINPSLRSVMLVALTGYGREEDRRLAIESGFDLHLVKPIEPRALKRLMAQALADERSAG